MTNEEILQLVKIITGLCVPSMVGWRSSPFDPNAAMIHRDGPAQPKPAAIQAPLLIESRPDTAGLMVVAALGQRW